MSSGEEVTVTDLQYRTDYAVDEMEHAEEDYYEGQPLNNKSVFKKSNYIIILCYFVLFLY
jgi:hypothetical protein